MKITLLFAGALSIHCNSATQPARQQQVGPTPVPTQVTRAEAAAFAASFEKYMNQCDPSAVNRYVDIQAMVATLGTTSPIVTDLLSAESIGGYLCATVPDQELSGYTLLRLAETADSAEPLFRVLTRGFLNYHRLRLIKSSDGVRIADIYVYAAGEHLSELLTTIAKTLTRAGQGGGALAMLLQEASERAEASDLAGLRAALARAPAEVQAWKALRLMEVSVAANSDSAEHAAVLARYRRDFPDDPAAVLVSLDTVVRRADWSRALTMLAQLDQQSGNDPYVLVLTSGVLVEKGELAAALTMAKTATQAAPTLRAAWTALMKVAILMENFDMAVSVLRGMTANGLAIREDRLLDPIFAKFRASQQFQTWTQSRR